MVVVVVAAAVAAIIIHNYTVAIGNPNGERNCRGKRGKTLANVGLDCRQVRPGAADIFAGLVGHLPIRGPGPQSFRASGLGFLIGIHQQP